VVYGSGPVLAAPNVVTVTFPGDANASQLASFGDTLTGSAYWTTVTADLTCGGNSACIGKGTGSSAVAPTSPGASYVDYQGETPPAGQPPNTMQPFLASIIAGLPASQHPSADTLYLFYFPSSTTITMSGGTSCASFYGYHNTMKIGGNDVSYVIVVECPPPTPLDWPTVPTLTNLQQATFTASHEVLEASSNPILSSSSTAPPEGYFIDMLLQSSLGWIDLHDGELGDLCVDGLTLGQDRTTEGNYTTQRIWSVANAAAGTIDPCVPSNGNVYFNAFPTVSAVIVPAVGSGTTFEVDALALGAQPPWSVIARDLTGALHNSPDTFLSFSIAGGQSIPQVNGASVITAKSGDKLQVTVTMLADPATAPGSLGWGTGGLVSANSPPGAAPPTAGNTWPFVVLTQAEATNLHITMMDPIPSHVLALARERAHARGHARPRYLDGLFDSTLRRAPAREAGLVEPPPF
jgi:hypothetical protein